MTISVLGACNQLDQALQLLFQQQEEGEGGCGDDDNNNNKKYIPNIGSYHAAIAACGKAKDWQRAMEVYQLAVTRGIATTLTTNTILTVLGQRRQGAMALQVLSEMSTPPDKLTYQHAITAMSKAGMVDEAFQIVQTVMKQQEQEQQKGSIITDRTFEALMAAYSKVSDWEGVKRVQLLRNPNFQPPHLSEQEIHRWTGLVKVGKGKESYWELATIDLPNCQILVGVHPNRNAMENGIQLLFFERDKNHQNLDANNDPPNPNNNQPKHRRKLGYLLMQNGEHQSCLLGMFLQGTIRGQGLSKVCMAFWLWLCLQADVTPTTGIINKPLLALLLEDKFGMVPNGKGGVEMELTSDPTDPGTVLLYAPNRKDLRGVFSPWDQQHQNLRLLKKPPETRGRMITVGTTFGVVGGEDYRPELQKRVQQILPDNDEDDATTSMIQCQLTTKEEFRRLFFCRDNTSSSPSSSV
jgi:pentatricopeptide repeat protein